MEIFYLIVLGIATLVLILILTFVGLLMQTGKKNLIYPPIANSCPDNWEVDGSNCIIPNASNTNMGGNSITDLVTSLKPYVTPKTGIPSNGFSPTDKAWAVGGLTTICSQKTWANKNNILWDGVSNYNSC